MNRVAFILFVFAVVNCCAEHYQSIRGRNQEEVYHVKAPVEWKRVNPDKPPLDTKLPLCEFYIEDSIRITIHNFPSHTLEDRIAPGAQIARWKRQLSFIEENVSPQSFSGYVGFLLEADDGETGIMGWIMQLGPMQYSRLPDPELRSDVTIKAQGPLELIHKYRQKIVTFARSFELIREI